MSFNSHHKDAKNTKNAVGVPSGLHGISKPRARSYWMEANMFPKAQVMREMRKYIRVRLYTDGQGELYEAHQKLEREKFGTVALPYYALVDSAGDPVASFAGLTREQAEFVAFLKSARPSTP